MEFMDWTVYRCVSPGFIKENLCVKMLDKEFLFLTVCSHLQVAVFQGPQIYLGDLCMITENLQKMFTQLFFPTPLHSQCF